MNTKNKLPIESPQEHAVNLLKQWLDNGSAPKELRLPPILQEMLYRHLEDLQRGLIPLRGTADWNHQRHRNHQLRMRALELLESRLLRNNPQLNAAGTPDVIRDQLDRSCKAALRYARLDLDRKERRKLARDRRTRENLTEADHGSACMHQEPSSAELLQCCEGLLEQAIAQRQVNPKHAETFLLHVRDGLPQAKIAKMRGVTPSAISRQIKHVAAKLARLQNTTERLENVRE